MNNYYAFTGTKDILDAILDKEGHHKWLSAGYAPPDLPPRIKKAFDIAVRTSREYCRLKEEYMKEHI